MGMVSSYIHAGSRIGVLVEVNCETDFVARGEKFKELVQGLAMQIAASPSVEYVAPEDASAEFVEAEKQAEMQKEDLASKPENIRAKIVEGRVEKIINERALLEQTYIMDTTKTVREAITESIASIGENIKVRRFSRYVLGEGIEKKTVDFATEVEEQTKAKSESPAPEKKEEKVEEKVEEKPAVAISAKLVNELRDSSGAGMMDCKKALAECGGDLEKAEEYLRKKGITSAAKKASRVASEGMVSSYIHAGSRIGVLVEVNCETDFVARGDKFKELVQGLAMQIAASPSVEYVAPEDASPEFVEAEKKAEMQKEDLASKPENIREKIVQGRVDKIINERALLTQAWIMDNNKTVGDAITEAIATVGENIKVRRFSRYVLGEGIEKKEENF